MAVTCHFNLIERAWMLRGMAPFLQDLYDEPARVESLLEMILQFKLELLEELGRRFGQRIDGIFLTDDWGHSAGTDDPPGDVRASFLPPLRAVVLGHSPAWLARNPA